MPKKQKTPLGSHGIWLTFGSAGIEGVLLVPYFNLGEPLPFLFFAGSL